MRKIKKFIGFIKEAELSKSYVNTHNKVVFDNPNSSMFMTDSEFDKFLEDGFNLLELEKMSALYQALSPEHKQKMVLAFMENQFLLDTSNTSKLMVFDAIHLHPQKFDEYLKENVSDWWNLGMGVLEWNPIFLELLGISIQEKVVNYIEEFGEYEIDMSNDMFMGFLPEIQEKILKTNLFNII